MTNNKQLSAKQRVVLIDELRRLSAGQGEIHMTLREIAEQLSPVVEFPLKTGVVRRQLEALDIDYKRDTSTPMTRIAAILNDHEARLYDHEARLKAIERRLAGN